MGSVKGFQPSPGNPFAGFASQTPPPPPIQGSVQAPATFGIQEKPEGLTDEMEAALAQFMGSKA